MKRDKSVQTTANLRHNIRELLLPKRRKELLDVSIGHKFLTDTPIITLCPNSQISQRSPENRNLCFVLERCGYTHRSLCNSSEETIERQTMRF